MVLNINSLIVTLLGEVASFPRYWVKSLRCYVDVWYTNYGSLCGKIRPSANNVYVRCIQTQCLFICFPLYLPTIKLLAIIMDHQRIIDLL